MHVAQNTRSLRHTMLVTTVLYIKRGSTNINYDFTFLWFLACWEVTGWGRERGRIWMVRFLGDMIVLEIGHIEGACMSWLIWVTV
jgi:hypothetical protein